MALYIRMILYFIFAGVASQGIGIFDADSGTLTLNVDKLAEIIGGLVGFVGTFVVGRFAKRRGGNT